MAFVVGAVIGAGAALVGSAISASAAGDAVDAQKQGAAEERAIQQQQLDYQKELQKPYTVAGTGALGLISTGLGIAPQVETRDQIRARLSGQNTGMGSNVSQNANNTANPFAKLGTTGGVFGSSTATPLNFQGVAGNAEQQLQARQILGLAGDNSSEANFRVNAYLQNNTNNQSQNATNPDLDAQVEAEYQKQLDAQKSAQNGSGFGEFNRDFTAADFDVNKDPGAVFRQQEAMKALQRTYAGSGNFLSGGALKGITKYNQDFASQEYGNAFDRFNVNKTNRFNRLASVANLGQTSANTVGNAGQNYANNVGNNATNLGNSIGSASLYGGRQLNNAVQSGANSISNYLGNRGGSADLYGSIANRNVIPTTSYGSGYADLSLGVF